MVVLLTLLLLLLLHYLRGKADALTCLMHFDFEISMIVVEPLLLVLDPHRWSCNHDVWMDVVVAVSLPDSMQGDSAGNHLLLPTKLMHFWKERASWLDWDLACVIVLTWDGELCRRLQQEQDLPSVHVEWKWTK